VTSKENAVDGRDRRRWPLAFLGLIVVAGGVAGCGTRQEPMQSAPRFTLEDLYSAPRIIGTAPKEFTWSADARRLAFLWNDEGTNFYDVWTIAVDDPKPSRATRMPRREAPRAGATGPDAVDAAVAAERDAGVQAVVWHPDGRRVLLTFRGDLYLAEAGQPPQKLGDAFARASAARFSPDGRTLAFVREGNLWVAAVSGETIAAARPLTALTPPDDLLESYRWAPDSRQLAFIERDARGVTRRLIPDYLTPETTTRAVARALPGEPSESRWLRVVAVDDRRVRPVNLGPNPLDEIFAYEWAPDGHALAVDKSDVFVKDRRIVVVEPSTGVVREWHREQNPENVTAQWTVRWAPDGHRLYFLSDRDEDYHIYQLAAPGAPPTRVTRGQWAVSEFEVSPTAASLFFVANEGRPEERHLYRVSLEGGPVRRLSRRSGTHAPVVSPDGRFAADMFSSDDTPYDLFLIRLTPSGAADDERQITSSPLPSFSRYRWAKAQYVTFPSRTGDVTLNGRLTLPFGLDKSRKYPAILGSAYNNTVRNQWGGRTAHPTWGLDQYLAQDGYVLLNVDVHQSWGRGRRFRDGIRLDYGGIDVEDLHSGVEYLKTLGYVDPERVGIWGSSYGGLLTIMSLFRKPGVYKAGVAGAPATNMWHATTGEMRVMGTPDDHPKEYAQSSPFTHAAGLQDHLMIIQGMRDTTVLFKDSVSLVQRLILLGKDVDLVALPDAPHGWDTEALAQTRFAFHKLVGHFERYLGKGPR
jgi:dipeptidyl-peptidase-4